MKYLNKFFLLPKDEKKLLFEAVILLIVSKILLMVPFRYCIKLLKPEENMKGIDDLIKKKKISNAVNRANKLAFWKNVCLVKSFTARLMLQRRNIGSKMYLGLQFTNDGKKLIAHAWLVSGELFITPKGLANYKEIFSI